MNGKNGYPVIYCIYIYSHTIYLTDDRTTQSNNNVDKVLGLVRQVLGLERQVLVNNRKKACLMFHWQWTFGPTAGCMHTLLWRVVCLRMVNPSPIYWSLSLRDSHTCQHIAAYLESVAEENGIQTNIRCIVTDNAANMRKAIFVWSLMIVILSRGSLNASFISF